MAALVAFERLVLACPCMTLARIYGHLAIASVQCVLLISYVTCRAETAVEGAEMVVLKKSV